MATAVLPIVAGVGLGDNETNYENPPVLSVRASLGDQSGNADAIFVFERIVIGSDEHGITDLRNPAVVTTP